MKYVLAACLVVSIAVLIVLGTHFRVFDQRTQPKAQQEVVGDTQIKEYTVEDVRAYETTANAKTGAVFLTVYKNGHEALDHRLIAASTDIAERVELHTHIKEDGIMRMRQVPNFDFADSGVVRLEPMGDHIMLINLFKPLNAGDTFPLRLSFDQHIPIELKVKVLPFTPDVIEKAKE